MTLAHIFAYNSKVVLPQSASFRHAGIHNYIEIIYLERSLNCEKKINFESNNNNIPRVKEGQVTYIVKWIMLYNMVVDKYSVIWPDFMSISSSM